MSEKHLELKNLKTYLYTDDGVVKSVDDVSFSVEKGKTLGIVGESGCGKSITSLSIMQLVETPPGKIVGGEILYQGENLLEKNKDQKDPRRRDRHDLPGAHDFPEPGIYRGKTDHGSTDATHGSGQGPGERACH